MKIKHLEYWVETFELREPYVIAYESIEKVENVFLRIETDGLVGWGSAAPDLEVSGECATGVVEKLRDVVEPALRGEDPLARARLLTTLEKPLASSPAALAAVDLALHDLIGKAAGLPLWRLLGGYRERIATSVTIGILDLEQTVAAARRRAAEGFLCLKLKGGRELDGDIERVLAVRRAVGPEIGLRFDANQGYTVDESVRFAAATRSAGLELFEQPTTRERPDWLGRVTAAVELPIMADESMLSASDVVRLSSGDLADMVNIKLMKVGGISRAQRVDAVARTARLETMVGCMDESAVSIAGALALALASPNVECADLDGHLDLVGDPAANAVPLVDGHLVGPAAPGLGIDLS